MPKTVDMRAQASLPGRVQVSPAVWLRCNPARAWELVFVVLGALLLPFAIFYFIHIGPLNQPILLGLSAAVVSIWGEQIRRSWFRWIKIKEHFQYGNLNPAIVVSLDPPLIAVGGDLSTRHGDPYPVVKIVRQPLHRLCARPRIGDHLAAVALYQGSVGRPHWNNFSPILAACVTDNPAVLRAALERIRALEPQAWEELSAHLARIPKPYLPQLYWMRPPTPAQANQPGGKLL